MDLQECRRKTASIALLGSVASGTMKEVSLRWVHSFKVQESAVTPTAPTYRMYALHALTKVDMSSESQEHNVLAGGRAATGKQTPPGHVQHRPQSLAVLPARQTA